MNIRTIACTLLLAASMLLPSCATYTTLSNPDRKIASQLHHDQTRCSVIPRVYSGLSYRFCTLHAEPGKFSRNPASNLIPYALDGVLSCIADTVVLPYTIYLQINQGSLVLSH
ncbi:MAG: YceK/YidQ family lipoprotein [Oceanospirillaceae bacterium]|nr:YceK/YidQ family lipoprotein [Oceanospirillaceae bacterium]MBT14312.1 YceK/YidQ family lipoprotein [Oceanospirillaceae bacterium]